MFCQEKVVKETEHSSSFTQQYDKNILHKKSVAQNTNMQLSQTHLFAIGAVLEMVQMLTFTKNISKIK